MKNKCVTYSVECFFKVNYRDLSLVLNLRDSEFIRIKLVRFLRYSIRLLNFVSYNSDIYFEVKSVDLDDTGSFFVCELLISSDNRSVLSQIQTRFSDFVLSSFAYGLGFSQVRKIEFNPYDFRSDCSDFILPFDNI